MQSRAELTRGEAQVEQFLSDLAVRQRSSPSTQKQALNAVVFLMQEALHRQLGDLQFHYAAAQRRIPVVLSREECTGLFQHLTDTPRLMAELMYGAGLRLMECLRLRIQDVDLASNQIVVRDGKGFKDRVTMVPETVKPSLETFAGSMFLLNRKRANRFSQLNVARRKFAIDLGPPDAPLPRRRHG
jgi:site-specific recombinase XerD